jgi:MFS family permease
MFPIAFGIIRELFPPEKLAIGVGIFSSMFAAGSVVGLALGGTIVEHLGWHATFFSMLPFAIILWFTISKFIHDPSSPIFNSNHSDPEHGIGYPKINNNVSRLLDIKGAILLTIAITSFLLAITYVGNSQDTHEQVAFENSYPNNDPFSSPFSTFLLLVAITIASLVLFILVEKKSISPLIDLKLFGNKILLTSNILVVTLGLSMFIVYQTIPFLVRNPQPVGFGGDAIEAAMVQLPFMIIFLIFAPTSGFIISRIGSIMPVLLGTIISLVGFISMYTFHSTEALVSVNLAIISVGFSLLNTGVFNIILTSTPMQFSGFSLGMTVVINIIGMSIGPIVAGFFMQSFQTISMESTYPSSTAYNMIFLTGIVISACSVGLSIILRRHIGYPKTNMA